MLAWIFSEAVSAQSTQTIFYTTREGLASNSVYRTVIDHRGFLWIATENGLARFDGKRFEVYTTAQGLTDNEIIDLFIDSSQTIWAIPFRRSPCYYNPRQDRFENAETDLELSKIDLANTHKIHILQFGGVAFSNNLRQLFVYRNGKTTAYDNFFPLRAGTVQKAVEYEPGKIIFFCDDSIRYFHKRTRISSIPFNRRALGAEYLNNKVYLAETRRVTVYAVGKKGNISRILEKEFPFEVRMFCNTGKNFAIASVNGNTYLVDTATLEIKENILNKLQVRNVLEDNAGNNWLATMENGLVKIQQKRISSFNGIPELLQNFNALIKRDDIIAGNNNGEIYIYDGLYGLRKIDLTEGKDVDAWVRKIIQTPKGIYIATQRASFLFDLSLNRILRSLDGPGNRSSKNALLLNDSMLCLGNHAMATRYNFYTGAVTDSVTKRVISLAVDEHDRIYIGSNDGLYRWDPDSLYSFGKIHRSFNYRVNTMTRSPDSIIWVGLGADALLALKNGKMIANIPLGGIVPGNLCKSLYCKKPGELWLGTNKGLNKIDYKFENGWLRYNNTYFGTADGLIGEQVNDITVYKDTVYVATSAGISFMPASLSLPVSDIATFVTRISINGVRRSVEDSYTLSYNENDITIEFSGVDLTGFIPLFEYSLNGGDWQQTEKIELKRLAPGSYDIRIRAIKRNGMPSKSEAALSIYVKTPFWQSGWFRTALGVTGFLTIGYVVQRRVRQKQRKQQIALEKLLTEKKFAELEMQALKAQINPHFVFNCLNSIKAFIYEKDYAQADKYLDKFSELLRSTMDNAEASIIPLQDELKYLDTYLQLEKLRFGNKFDYTCTISEDIDRRNTFVPAMLLQPYVENAIRHGVRHLQTRKGQINISTGKTGDSLICEIEDNGVGRQAAEKLKGQKHIEYQSRGMQLSRRRAELFDIHNEIIDKTDEHGRGAGTRIVLKIPLKLKP
ncbi:MAG TPA: histidine kinase [Chitinophagaceae bacterium]|nr:histidine kinase [Chitinophagaceae bacterium]